MRRRLVTAAVALLGWAVATAQPALPRGCDSYTYAGFQSPAIANGVSARLTVLAQPRVAEGHVAAWVGLGGYGMGAGGADAWVQVGIAGYPGGRSELYYEFHRAGELAPRYVPLAVVSTGAAHDVAVVRGPAADAWRIVVDHAVVGRPVVTGSGRTAWRPIATAENWDGGVGSCNGFSYDFSALAVTPGSGSTWRPFRLTASWRDAGLTLRTRRAGFAANAR